MLTPCYMLEPTTRHRRFLRRYTYSDQCPCPANVYTYNGAQHYGGHEARAFLDIVDETVIGKVEGGDNWPHDDPRWPTHCEHCGEWLSPGVRYQLFTEAIWVVGESLNPEVATGLEFSIREAPPGALWYATWLEEGIDGMTGKPRCEDADGNEIGCWRHLGPDGHVLAAKCPGGATWIIDSRANNCALPNDNEHACWCRAGVPPRVSITKDCKSCAAGAGSIATGNYHGFLTAGIFSDG